MKITFEELREKIAIKAELLVVDVNRDDKLEDDLGLDSLDVVEIIMEIETQYNINIPDNYYENAETVDELLTAVNK